MDPPIAWQLDDPATVLWQQYLVAEQQGRRKHALTLLATFVQRITAAPMIAWTPFAEQLCQLVVDDPAHWRLALRQPLIDQIVFPFLIHAYATDHQRAPWWLAALHPKFVTRPYWWAWLEQHNLTLWDLFYEARRRDPHNPAALALHLDQIAEHFNYAIHEVPYGVLAGIHGASIEQCHELLDLLAEFQRLLIGSGRQEQYAERVRTWEFHFRGYADYLGQRSRYQSYAHYVDLHRP